MNKDLVLVNAFRTEVMEDHRRERSLLKRELLVLAGIVLFVILRAVIL